MAGGHGALLGRSFRPGSRETVRGVNLIGTHFPRARARAEPSDAFRQQTDPLEPAGRRFANFFFDSSTKKRLSE